MSAEELKIREELEIDVERELEEELKDEIYRIGLRLHRLYQQQKQRELSEPVTKNKKALSEVNINIKMEGGTKIEIKEIKQETREKNYVHNMPKVINTSENIYRSSKLREENTRQRLSSKKFDWAKTLRSGAGNVDFRKTKALKNGPGAGRVWDDSVQIVGVTTKCASAMGQRKGKRLLELKS